MMPPPQHVCNGLARPAIQMSPGHWTSGQRDRYSRNVIDSAAHRLWRRENQKQGMNENSNNYKQLLVIFCTLAQKKQLQYRTLWRLIMQSIFWTIAYILFLSFFLAFSCRVLSNINLAVRNDDYVLQADILQIDFSTQQPLITFASPQSLPRCDITTT